MKKKGNTKKPWFWLAYGTFALYICIFTALGLLGFYFYTAEYESSLPKTCVASYCDAFADVARARLEALCDAQCGAYEPHDAAIDEVLMPMLGVEYAYKRAGDGSEHSPAYIIYTKDRKRELAKVTLREHSRSRLFHLPQYTVDACEWLLDLSAIESFPVHLTAPVGAAVTVNGIKLTQAADGEAIAYPSAPGEQRTGLPLMQQYTLNGFLRMPQITATGSDGTVYDCLAAGADVLLTRPGSHTVRVTVPPDATVKIGETVLSPELYAVDKEVPYETDCPFGSQPWVSYEVMGLFEPAAVSASSPLYPQLPLEADGDTYTATPGNDGTVRVETPFGMDCTVLVNGIDIENAGIETQPAQYSFLTDISGFLNTPTMTEAVISGFDTLPQVTVQADGAEMVRVETDDPTQFLYVPVTEEVPADYNTFVGSFIEALVYYTNMGGKYFGTYLYKVQGEILDGSPAEKHMYAAGYYYAVNHVSQVLDISFQAHDLVRYSDTCFSLIVDYESVLFGRVQFTEQATSKLYYVFSGGRWLVADFAFLH